MLKNYLHIQFHPMMSFKNHMWVKKFIEEYKSRVTGLPNPMEQIHVLASELHPNKLSEQLIHASDFKDIYREELKISMAL